MRQKIEAFTPSFSRRMRIFSFCPASTYNFNTRFRQRRTIVFLLIYIFVRHRYLSRLKKAHNDLKVAYDQLEEATVTKERMESELRIASNIQMSMIPNVFPKKDGLDMYASMTTAKEVGGDLYNYLLKDNKLYFCIGDVSGKGVPASLFMTIATRGFRTLAAMGKSPEEIATRMNLELSENNEAGMFVPQDIWEQEYKLSSVFCQECLNGRSTTNEETV